MDNSNGPWQKDKKKKKRSGSRRPSTCKYCKIRPSPRSRGTMWTAGTSSSRLSSQVEAKTNRLRLRTVGAPAGTLVRAEGSSCWWALHGSKHCRRKGWHIGLWWPKFLGNLVKELTRKRQNKPLVSALQNNHWAFWSGSPRFRQLTLLRLGRSS